MHTSGPREYATAHRWRAFRLTRKLALVTFDRVRRGCGAALTAVAAMCVATRAAVTQNPQSTAPAPPAPADSTSGKARLFDAGEPLALTLKADFGAIFKQRSGTKRDVPGVISYVTGSGDSIALDVQLRTRGHFRLANCQYPPLKVGFDRERAAKTVFAHQGNGVKLVVQCRGGQTYANYLLEEYLIYRTYNLLTDLSFRVRLARVTYLDANGKRESETRYGFFVEDDDRMARRNHTNVLDRKGVSQTELEPDQMGLTAVFEYMIGNTDWAVSALHNIVLLSDSVGTTVYPVPYDFDWSGVIWPPYARPDPSLTIHTVRERTFRGTCRTPQDLAFLFAPFNARKDAIYTLYRDMEKEGLEAKRVEQALEYYDEFYKTINDKARTQSAFIRGCQG